MQLYQKVQGQGAAAPPGTQKLDERDVVAVSFLPSDEFVTACLDVVPSQTCVQSSNHHRAVSQ